MIRVAAWLFIIATCAYYLYSSNKLLHHHSKCQGTSDDVAEKVGTIIIPNISSSHRDIPMKRFASEREVDTDTEEDKPEPEAEPTQLKHIVFGIAASADLFSNRKQYIKTWWNKSENMRGVIWIDRNVTIRRNDNFPKIHISGNTSHLRYTHPEGRRDALRLSRVVSETYRLGLKDVRWFVMGDDDTVFVADNVIRVLSKYDHRDFYYIGAPSESHVQNIQYFSYAMAYGGGGFAISYPLAKELEKMQDRCMERYPGLYGSDDRMQACMAELGVPLTREIGFHQYDVFGNLLGLLAAHPVTPLVSLHHLDNVEPIFPNMTRPQAIRHLFKSIKLDSASVLQQSICYDKHRSWSITVSWGYVVQIIRGIMSPRELEMPSRTFLNWWKRVDYSGFSFNTRPVTRHPCQVPFMYYMNKTWYDEKTEQIIGVYKLDRRTKHPFCRWRAANPEGVDTFVITKKPDRQRWRRSPRRDCCRVEPSTRQTVAYLDIGKCQPDEISEL